MKSEANSLLSFDYYTFLAVGYMRNTPMV